MNAHSEPVTLALENLRALDARHREVGLSLGKAHDGDLYPLDFFAIGALNRSMALLDGFASMVEARNFISAAALLRLELDTALRFSAAWLVDSPHVFAMEVLGGTPVRRISDREGKRMTDAHLVSVLKSDEPWIEELYEHTSGYIHLSEKHIFNAIASTGDEGVISMKASPVDQSISDEHYLEAIAAFNASADLFLRYLEGWVLTKDAGSAEEAARRLCASQSDDD